jgi:hypothetical protein
MAVLERLGRGIGGLTSAPVSLFEEAMRILPDGLILGIGFFSLITLSFPHGVFFASLIEALLAFYGLRAVNERLALFTALPGKASLSNRCRTGFSNITMDGLTMFGDGLRSAFPSAPIFILSTAATYMIGSMMALKKEMEVMGKEYTSRLTIAAVALPIVLAMVILYRLYNSCDAMTTILATGVVGGLLGFALTEQNRRIFGESALNLIGIPLLRQRTATGEKLYVCPTQLKV